MAAQTLWKGYLKLSLVTCAVTLTPAVTARERLRFHTLNRKTGNRVESRYVDAVTGRGVAADDQGRGYARGEDDFIAIEDDDLDAVALESARTIDIDTFVPAASIGWIWYDAPHFLVPADDVGQEAFAVIREAMADSRTVGISRLVLYRREHAVLLQPRDHGIILWTLRYGDEVRDAQPLSDPESPDRKTLALVRRMIESRTKPWDPALLQDPVEGTLRDIIARRAQAKRPKTKAEKPVTTPSNVIDITDALRRSVAAESKPKGRPRSRG